MSDDVATDAEIAEAQSISDALLSCGRYSYEWRARMGSILPKVFNRLAASEKECEWRGLLIGAFQHRWELRIVDIHGSGIVDGWRLFKLYDPFPEGIEWGGDVDRVVPLRPSDDVVAKIKEVVNG